MTRRRIAMIGLGMAAKPHARSLVELAGRVEVAAAFSRTAARREAFAQDWALPAGDDLDAIMADPGITAVLVLTPPATHLDLVGRATAAGKHVLLEKPLETNTRDAERLVETAEAAGVALGVVFQNRFSPACLALEALIAEGRLGRIVSASLALDNWRPQSYHDEPGRGTLARDGGGVLITQGIHPINQLIAFAGQPTDAAAFAMTSPVHRMETEDVVAASLRFASGALGSVSATTCAYPGAPTEIRIVGELGTAVLTDSRLTAAFHDGTRVETGPPPSMGGAGADPMGFDHANHRAVITDFLDAIDAGRPPKITGREALRSHDLIDAILSSARTGRREAVVSR